MKVRNILLGFAWWFTLLNCIALTGYVVFSYGTLPLGSVVHPDMKAVFVDNKLGIYAHVFASIAALLLGPFQFSQKLRNRFTALHRTFGKIYLFAGVGLGGLAGLYMAHLAFGGLPAKVGFTSAALVWLFTGYMAYAAIRKGDVGAHQNWMIRNFALTLSAITLRFYLGGFMAAGIPFHEFYPIIAWLSWIPNLIVAEFVFVKRQKAFNLAT